MLTPGIEERLVRNDETRDRRKVREGMTTPKIEGR